ncbi:hypothetical protein sS8_1883 [Methylocaldum marinum]|uniref:Uncharacterized protein n=1 Tax=Methylocaldum marinum TaxID=1432792 RepID=A0A250KQG5_9GAMM|nr:hypothetical protein sS8_1883 [Methylocaldum marinum]
MPTDTATNITTTNIIFITITMAITSPIRANTANVGTAAMMIDIL